MRRTSSSVPESTANENDCDEVLIVQFWSCEAMPLHILPVVLSASRSFLSKGTYIESRS